MTVDDGGRGQGQGRQRTAVITLFSAARLEHAQNQFAMLLDAGGMRAGSAGAGSAGDPSAGDPSAGDPGAGDPSAGDPSASPKGAGGPCVAPLIVGVWLDAAEPPAIEGVTVIHVPPAGETAELAAATSAAIAPAAAATPPGASAAGRLRLAAGRNAGARAALAAGSRLLVFLDADCLPGPELLERYAEAAAEHPESVLCGPVTYLPEGADPRTARELHAATAPHAARPNLPAGETRAATDDEYRLFWSLSFACTAPTWSASGGFAEVYEGYGAEDTDFASTLRQRALELRWVGGAHAYHQYHPTSSPPWQHLDDILRNGALYHARWGSWPMEGWLEAFAEAGAVERSGDSWRLVPDAVGRPLDNVRLLTQE